MTKDELSQKAIYGQKRHFWPFLEKKPFQIWQKYFWPKSHFWPKSINLTQDFLYQKFWALFSRNHLLMYSRRKEEKSTMMHFEALFSGDDLLAIWWLETLQLHQLMILSSHQNFAELLFTRQFFFKMHLCGVVFNSYLG